MESEPGFEGRVRLQGQNQLREGGHRGMACATAGPGDHGRVCRAAGGWERYRVCRRGRLAMPTLPCPLPSPPSARPGPHFSSSGRPSLNSFFFLWPSIQLPFFPRFLGMWFLVTDWTWLPSLGGATLNERIENTFYYSQAFYLSLQAFWQVVKTPCKSFSKRVHMLTDCVVCGLMNIAWCHFLMSWARMWCWLNLGLKRI